MRGKTTKGDSANNIWRITYSRGDCLLQNVAIVSFKGN